MATVTELEQRILILEKQVTDLNNIIQNLLPKIQMKQFSLLVEQTLDTINKELENIKSRLAQLENIIT